MTARYQITNNIKGNVENLVSINEVKGDFVNNGTIYLVATYQACQQMIDTGMSADAFKAAAENYIDKLKKYHARHDMVGMTEKGNLSDYYVLPRMKIVKEKPEEITVSAETLTDVFSHEETFIYGAAGSGKSTLLKYVIWNILDLKIGAIPVFISLAVFRHTCRLFSSHTLYEQIVQELKEYNFPKNFVEFMLENAPVILLLDGFDEAYRNTSERALLIEQIESYRKIHNDEWSKIVITSRTKDYSFYNPRRQNLELLPFDQSQVNNYLEKRLKNEDSVTQFLDNLTSYYDLTFENRNITDSPELDRIYERTCLMAQSALVMEGVHDVVIRKRNYPAILSSPILLSLLVFQFEQGGKVYDNKLALLQNLVKNVIEKNRTAKQLDDIYNWLRDDQLEKFFAYLAYNTLKKGEIIIERSRLYSLTGEFLKLNAVDVKDGIDLLFKPLVNDFGLLSAVGSNQFRFQHLYIQEYLAASFLNENSIDDVFDNGLLLRASWNQAMGLLLEMRSEDQAFSEKYFTTVSQILNASEKVKELIEHAKKKALDVDGNGCYGISFYYICIRLYFNIGDRGIYSSLRITAEILHRVLELNQKDAAITLLSIGQEMTYVARKISHENLLIDSWLFRLFETYIIKKEAGISIDEVITAFNNTGDRSLIPLLKQLKSGITENNESKINGVIGSLLIKRNLSLDEWVQIEDLNILCKWLDLIESYLKAVPGFGRDNNEYLHFFTSAATPQKLSFTTEDQDYLTSRDYFELGGKYEKVNRSLAEQYISKAITKNPTNSFFYWNRGAYHFQNGNLQKSLDDFISAERLNADYNSDYTFQLNFGVLYKWMNEYEKALDRFKRASEIKAETIRPEWFSVEILVKTGQYAKAAVLSEKLTKINPVGHFYYTAAYCDMKSGKYAKAVKNIEEAMKLDYCIPESLFIKAYCELELGKIAEVQAWLSSYLKNKTATPFLYLPLLHSYKLKKNKKLYDQTRKIVQEINLLDKNNFQPNPLAISPGHMELKEVLSTYHTEDFILPTNYILFNENE